MSKRAPALCAAALSRRRWLSLAAGLPFAAELDLARAEGTSRATDGTEAPSATPPGPELALQPLGDFSPSHLSAVETALKAFYAYPIRSLAPIPLPASAYYTPRRRYRAEKLLNLLERERPQTARFVLGLTDKDISTTKGRIFDWGILGLANISGSACVISSFRTHRGARNPKHSLERLQKTAVHEIGHNLGLEHCPNRGCLMEDGKGSVFTTDHEWDLCARCRTRLARTGAALASGKSPWPAPGANERR